MAKIKTTNKQLFNTFQALSKLDPGLDPKSGAKSAFNFKAKVSYALARNYKRLRGVVDDLEKARVATFQKYRSEAQEETLKGDAAKKFTAEFTELLDSETDFEFYTIDAVDLELDKNNINVDVLAALLDTIITGDIA